MRIIKSLLVGTLVVGLVFGGLVGCGGESIESSSGENVEKPNEQELIKEATVVFWAMYKSLNTIYLSGAYENEIIIDAIDIIGQCYEPDNDYVRNGLIDIYSGMAQESSTYGGSIELIKDSFGNVAELLEGSVSSRYHIEKAFEVAEKYIDRLEDSTSASVSDMFDIIGHLAMSFDGASEEDRSDVIASFILMYLESNRFSVSREILSEYKTSMLEKYGK